MLELRQLNGGVRKLVRGPADVVPLADDGEVFGADVVTLADDAGQNKQSSLGDEEMGSLVRWDLADEERRSVAEGRRADVAVAKVPFDEERSVDEGRNSADEGWKSWTWNIGGVLPVLFLGQSDQRFHRSLHRGSLPVLFLGQSDQRFHRSLHRGGAVTGDGGELRTGAGALHQL